MSGGTIPEIRARIARARGEEITTLLGILSTDPRAGVRALVASTRARLARETAERLRLDTLMSLQLELHGRGLVIIAGVDEVGRGALAGPVTAGAVVLAADTRIEGLDDSKRLTHDARTRVAARVRSLALAFSVAHVGAPEIDRLGIAPATRLAWRRALEGLGMPVDHILVDGNDGRGLGPEATPIIKGDSRVACIAAASVIAKVERDSLMELLSLQYPGYGFEGNRGYGAAEHLERLREVGPCPVHRRSFAPCADPDHLF